MAGRVSKETGWLRKTKCVQKIPGMRGYLNTEFNFQYKKGP